MIIKRSKSFSGTRILNTNAPQLGFKKGRKYDTDLDRLGRMKTSQRELSKLSDLRSEARKLNSELHSGRLGQWQQDIN